jgi:signal recognition particle GTPase
VGVGEQADDLIPFDPERFIASLFDAPGAGTPA